MQRPEPEGRRGNERQLRARGRRLLGKDLHSLQRFVDRRQDLTLREIAVELAKLWQWRRPSGELRERACATLLLRLARRGDLRLPPQLHKHLRRRKRPRSTPVHPREETDPAWPRGEENPGSGPGNLVVRPLSDGEQAAWDRFMERYHYLGRPARVGEQLRYAALLDGQLVALLGWGPAALKCAPRDRYIGWAERQRIENLQFVANNLRFLIVPGVKERNLASRVLGANLRRLSADWVRAFAHPIYLAETFVDPSRFRGGSYRASSWRFLGETRGWSKQGRGYRYHGQRKLVFVYPLHRRARDLLARRREKEAKETMVETFDVNALPLSGEGGLFEVLERIPDPRRRQGLRHPLVAILALAACATLSGAKSLEAIAQWAAGVSVEVLKRLGCRRRLPPSEPTFRRTLGKIGIERFEAEVGQWFRQRTNLPGRGIALDGKSLCGSADGDQPAPHLMSVQTHEEGVVLAQGRVSEKTNEIKAVKPLLDPLDIEGAVVTADAMHAQKETARYIVEEKKADYVLMVKENQPTLLEDIQTLRLGDFPPSGEDDEQGARPAGNAQRLGEHGAERLP